MYQRRLERIEGYVADYCVICRDVVAYQVVKTHPRDGAEVLLACPQCRIRIACDVSKYRSLAKDAESPVHELIEKTHPLLPPSVIDRAHLDYRLITRTTSDDVREEAIREPFRLASYLMGAGPGVGHPLLTGVALGFLGGIATLRYFATGNRDMWAWQRFGMNEQGIAWRAGLVFFFAGLLFHTCWVQIAKHRRQELAIRIIARALRPLRPNEQELTSALKMLHLAGQAPKAYTATRILEAITPLTDTSFSNMSYVEIENAAKAHFQAQQDKYQSFGHVQEETDEPE